MNRPLPLPSLVAGSLLLFGAASAQDDDKALKKAQVAIEQSGVQAAHALAKAVKEEPVAWLDLRPTVESPEGTAAAAPVQEFVLKLLLREGVLSFPLERERKVSVDYKDGKLPAGILASTDDLRSLAERKVRYLAVPRLQMKETSAGVMIDVFDLDKAQKVAATGVGPFPTKKHAIADLCAAEPLPARNAKVLAFAAANFGRQVDRGECWDLAANPVNASGGKVDGYKFGKPIPWEEGRPGDIVTFGTDGATGGHVMVLYKWTKVRAAATILHQNVNGVRRVMLGSLGSVESNKAGQPFALWRP